jgi:hypothetical protein
VIYVTSFVAVSLVDRRNEPISRLGRRREVGIVLHMASAIAGRIGLTAIGDTLDEARQRDRDVKAAVDAAARA